MPNPNPAKPRCADCGNPPVDALTEAKRLLSNLFNENEHIKPAQWEGSPMRAEIEAFLYPERVAKQTMLDQAFKDIEQATGKWNVNIDCSVAMRAVVEAMLAAGYKK